MTGNLTDTTIPDARPGSTTMFTVKSHEPERDLSTHRVVVDIHGGTWMGVRLDMSRDDAMTLARGILSEAGFVLDGAPVDVSPVLKGASVMAGKTNAILLTVTDPDNAAEQNGFSGESYSLICESSKVAQDLLYQHVARNWEENWGQLPGKAAAIKLYFTPDGDTAEEQTMPSEEKFYPTATYSIAQLPFVTEERSQKMVAAATKGLIKTKAKAPKAKKAVGSRE